MDPIDFPLLILLLLLLPPVNGKLRSFSRFFKNLNRQSSSEEGTGSGEGK